MATLTIDFLASPGLRYLVRYRPKDPFVSYPYTTYPSAGQPLLIGSPVFLPVENNTDYEGFVVGSCGTVNPFESTGSPFNAYYVRTITGHIDCLPGNQFAVVIDQSLSCEVTLEIPYTTSVGPRSVSYTIPANQYTGNALSIPLGEVPETFDCFTTNALINTVKVYTSQVTCASIPYQLNLSIGGDCAACSTPVIDPGNGGEIPMGQPACYTLVIPDTALDVAGEPLYISYRNAGGNVSVPYPVMESVPLYSSGVIYARRIQLCAAETPTFKYGVGGQTVPVSSITITRSTTPCVTSVTCGGGQDLYTLNITT